MAEPRKRRGRPSIYDGPTATAHVQLEHDLFDALCREAMRANRSISRHLNTLLKHRYRGITKRQNSDLSSPAVT